MPERPSARRLAVGALALALAFLAIAPSLAATAPAPPVLPAQLARGFLVGLEVSPTGAGSSTELVYSVANPLPAALQNVSLRFELYAFNPYPGTGSTSLPDPAPALAGGGTTGTALTLGVGMLPANASGWNSPVRVVVPSGVPSGSYAIRDELDFTLNGSLYRLASIGEFSAEAWHNATVLPNGTPTLNLTRLGVSGVLPETSLVVPSAPGLDVALYALAGAAGALLLAGAYVAGRRRGPASSSGARSEVDGHHAPSAFGKSRSREGD